MSTKPYVRAVPTTTWYFARKRDLVHMAQEVSCIFIGLYAVLLLLGVRAIAHGPEAYQAFLAGLGSPAVLLLQWITLGFAVFHSVSWFGVTHKAMPIQIGEEFLPGSVIVGGHYAAWAVVSLIILYLVGVF